MLAHRDEQSGQRNRIIAVNACTVVELDKQPGARWRRITAAFS